MKAKLDAQVQNLRSVYFNFVTGESNPDAVQKELNELFRLFLEYKTRENCIYEHLELSELLLEQALAENLILPNIRKFAENKSFDGAVFELLMAAKAPAELVARFAASLQESLESSEDLLKRGLQELRQIYFIAMPLYIDGNTEKLNEGQVFTLLHLTHYSAALRALARHYNIAAGESTKFIGDEVLYNPEVERTNQNLANYFKLQAEQREAQEDALLRELQAERASGVAIAGNEEEDMIDHSLAAVMAAVNLRQAAAKKPKVEVKQVLVEAKKQANLLAEILRVKGSLRKFEGERVVKSDSTVSDELAKKLAFREAKAAAASSDVIAPSSKPTPPQRIDSSSFQVTLKKVEERKPAAASSSVASMPAFDPMAAKAGLKKPAVKVDSQTAEVSAPMSGMDPAALLKGLKKAAAPKIADDASSEVTQHSFKHILKPVAKAADQASASSNSPAPGTK